jgi:hypothetical protein
VKSVREGVFRELSANWMIAEAAGDFDSVVISDIIAGNCIIKAILKVNTALLSKNYAGWEKAKALDRSSEFLNQVIGVVSYNFIQLGIQAKMSLPVALTPQEYRELTLDHFTPGVRVVDEHGMMAVELNFTNLTRQLRIALGDAPFLDPVDSIDFL